jgi:Circadian oscillating protein COP23
MIQKTRSFKHYLSPLPLSSPKAMKSPFLRPIVIATALGLIAAPAFVQPVQAGMQGNAKFFCSAIVNPTTGEKMPMTLAKTQRGNVAMIRWKSNFFKNGVNDFTPMSRCNEVSRRFQDFYNQGILSYLTTGKMNAQNVICVAEEYGGPCSGLLLTLEPKDNPQQVLQELMNVRTRASGGPLTRGAASAYFDVEDFLATAPVEATPTQITPEQTTTLPAAAKPSLTKPALAKPN